MPIPVRRKRPDLVPLGRPAIDLSPDVPPALIGHATTGIECVECVADLLLDGGGVDLRFLIGDWDEATADRLLEASGVLGIRA